MNTLNIACSIALISLVTACGSGGSQTLDVTGFVFLDNAIDNAASLNDFTASFRITVTRAGATVDNAAVTIESDVGTVELDFVTDIDGLQYYDGSQVAGSGSYRIDVIAGDDYLTGAVFEVPDVHTFTAPLPGASVSGTDPLEVTWVREMEADRTNIETRELNVTTIPDGGTYTIPVGGLRVDRDQVEDERIRLWRMNSISPTGGANGSSLNVMLRNEINILVEPNPSL